LIPTNQRSNQKIIIWCCLLFLVFGFFFFGLGSYDLKAPDEPRFALVAREMLTDHHWVLPHRNGNPYPDKPPLFFWTIAAFSALSGGTVNAWTSRLPCAVAATLILLLMWRWSKRGKEETWLPFLTVVVLLSCIKFFFQARTAQIDMVLCLFTTAALLTGYNAMTGKPYSAFGLGMFMGLGILAKGPVGYLVPAGAMALFAAFNGRNAWRRYPVKSLLWGLVPVVGWLSLLVLEVAHNGQWDYLNNLLFKQTVVRYASAWHHHQPFYYFFLSILYDFLPWTPFLLLALPVSKTRWRSLDEKQKFSWIVILFTMVFFSLSKGKRNLYILPLFPFAAYLTAVKIEAVFNRKQVHWQETGVGIFISALFFIIGAALMVIAAGWVDIPVDWIDAPLPSAGILSAGFLLLLLSLMILMSSIRQQFKIVVGSMVAAMLVVSVLFFMVVLPWLNPYMSARGIMEKVNPIIHSQSKNPVVGMVNYRSEYRLYGDFPLVELADENGRPRPELPKIENFFDRYPEGWLILRHRDWDRFAKTHNMEAKIHFMQKVGRGKNIMLVTKKDTGI
jgi:4-amino-4-deoxy-L-arabinose transferase-like glycosyltransferase